MKYYTFPIIIYDDNHTPISCSDVTLSLDDLHSQNFEPVIYCKDCYHCSSYSCNKFHIPVNSYDYCSRGEANENCEN